MIIYNLTLYLFLILLLPLIIIFLLWKLKQHQGGERGWRERWGIVPWKSPHTYPIWVHAVSVGEVQAAEELVTRLLDRFPDHGIIITTVTATGRRQAQRLFGKHVRHSYMPYDTPFAVRRFLTKTKPRLLLIMESEIWPNVIHLCNKSKIKVVLANARMTLKSFRKYRVFRWLISSTFRKIHFICAKNEEARKRFIALGALPERVLVTGNMKFDILPKPPKTQRMNMLRQETIDRPVWIAASIHKGEEAYIIQAHQEILKKEPTALLFFAPRQPEHFKLMHNCLLKAGFGVARRSLNERIEVSVNVFLVDTLGELRGFFILGQAAFVGGTFIPLGGHNILETANHRIPVAVGPYIEKIEDETRLLENCGALAHVKTGNELGEAISTWISDKTRCKALGEKAYQCILAERGATDTVINVLTPMLTKSTA